jgi:hypothetical protein
MARRTETDRAAWLPPSLLKLALTVAFLSPVGGCSKSSPHPFDSLEIRGETVLDNPILGLDAERVRQRLLEKLGSSGRFQSVAQSAKGQAGRAVKFELELPFTRLVQKDGNSGSYAEVGATVVIKRREPDGFATYEVVGVGQVKLAGDDPVERLSATRRALDSALEQVVSAAHLQLAALEKSDGALIKDLTAEDARVREFAIRVLSARKNPAVQRSLLEKLQASDPDSVRRAIGALVELKEAGSVPALIELSKGKDPGFLREIIFALGAIGGEEAEAYLYTVAEGHDQPAVRAAAAQALKELRARGGEVGRR